MNQDIFIKYNVAEALSKIFKSHGEVTMGDVFAELDDPNRTEDLYATKRYDSLMSSLRTFILSLADLDSKRIIEHFFPVPNSVDSNEKPVFSDILIRELLIFLDKKNLFREFAELLYPMRSHYVPSKDNLEFDCDSYCINDIAIRNQNKVLVAQIRVYNKPQIIEGMLEDIDQDPNNFHTRVVLGKLMLLNDFNYYIVPLDTRFQISGRGRCYKISDCSEVYVLKSGEIIWSNY